MAKRPDPMTDLELCGVVNTLVKDARAYSDERSVERIKAMEYFDGEMNDTKAEDNRSSVVSRDVRSAVKKVLPSVNRTLLGSDEIVEYLPVGEDDEAGAEQASDYVNLVALPECNGRRSINDAINDALRLRNGILKWYQKRTIDMKVSLHTGLDEESFVMLLSDDNVEALEHTERAEQVQTPQGMQEIPVHDVKIKRRIETSIPAICAIPPENWLIHPDAVSLEDSPILGENFKLRRSDLVKMGYDRDVVDALPTATTASNEQEAEEDTRRRDVFSRDDAPSKALEEVDYYDLLIRVDYDNDGIAELRRMVFAGGLAERNLLENTEWDEINYADIVSERRPHQWEGNSIPDDTMDIQRINSVLLRGTLDNLYWQNNLQPIVQEGTVSNPDSVMSPKFGEPIFVPNGTDVRAAVGYSQVPMVADKSFTMIQYMKGELTERTGISDASSGLAPDALQNMTAKASAMIEQGGIGQTEMMVSCIAESLVPVFKGLLKLVIQHQDRPRTVKLRDKWVTVDPRSWNADMDAQVNTGLGAGTRERDMLAVQQVIALQKELLGTLGPNNPYVKPDQLYNAIAKLVQSTGLKNVSMYFTKPDPQEIEALQKSQQEQPKPDEIKAKAAMELEQVRTQGRIQVEEAKAAAKAGEYDKKMQADAMREREQRDADIQTNLAELERQAAIDQQQIEADLEEARMRQETEREWMATQEIMLDKKLSAEEARQWGGLAARMMQGNAAPAEGRRYDA